MEAKDLVTKDSEGLAVRTADIKTTLSRGLHKRCPQCGVGNIFEKWNRVNAACAHCGCDLQTRDGDCWAFMYLTTAFLTGIIILFMFLFLRADIIPNILPAQIVIALAWLVLVFLTLPYRKGLAIAIDFLIDSRFEENAAGQPNKS
jgi:uncharacterized protein (DUF983 family)